MDRNRSKNAVEEEEEEEEEEDRSRGWNIEVEGRERITAQEAAARLGVKRATLYAYVSRGLLESRTLDGKTSTFDPREVERLQGRRRGAHSSAVGMPVVSAITRIEGDTFAYRGHDVIRMAGEQVPFEAVAELLWTGTLPADRVQRWIASPELVVGARRVQAAFPADAPIFDRLRATTAFASASDPLRTDLNPRSIARAARALIALLVDALPTTSNEPTNDTRLAARLWPRLTEHRATTKWRNTLNAALVLLADHDLAASTFAARVAASARADVYSIVGAGLGPFGGALHGAASRGIHDAFVLASEIGAPHAAGQLLQHGRIVAGFGHFLYPDGDPRAAALLPMVRDAAGDTRRGQLVDDLVTILSDRLGSAPNVDCGLAAMSFLARMDAGAGGVFAIARTAGWVAHGLAELDERPLRFRPVSRWVG